MGEESGSARRTIDESRIGRAADVLSRIVAIHLTIRQDADSHRLNFGAVELDLSVGNDVHCQRHCFYRVVSLVNPLDTSRYFGRLDPSSRLR